MSILDSSLLVAAIAPGEDSRIAVMRIENAGRVITSSIVVFETVLALCRIRQAPVGEMTEVVREFLKRAGATIESVDADLYSLALQAFERYGKGTGHPARLNMGDCFSYAMAKRAGVPLLYKGDDFVQTDLA